MNTPQIFSNEKFGRVRIIMVDNKPMFLANDVAKALGYTIHGKRLAIIARV